MNLHEKKYVINRITKIEREKLTEAQKLVTSKEVRLTNQEKIDKLNSGEFKTRPIPQAHNNYGSWYNYIDFGETHPVVDTKKLEPLKKKIITEAENLRDQVMLGNKNDEILKLIIDFANLKLE